MARKHLTLTPAQAKRLSEMGSMMHGSGMIPSNFDDDDDQWEDHSYIDFPVYISKGKGQYAGQGGGFTSMLKLLYDKAKGNPEVRKLAKRVAKSAVSKGAELAKSQAKKRGVTNPMANQAIELASDKTSGVIDKHLGSGKRVRVNGYGTSGVRMSGSGHCGRGTRAAGSEYSSYGSGTKMAGSHCDY